MSRKMSKLDVTKKHYSKLKAMSKITNIPSEIRNFFSEKRAHPTNPVECCADANPKTMLPNDT